MKKENRCQDKRRYNNEVDARKERLYIEKEYNKKFRIYNCSDCNGWHFSTMNWYDWYFFRNNSRYNRVFTNFFKWAHSNFWWIITWNKPKYKWYCISSSWNTIFNFGILSVICIKNMDTWTFKYTTNTVKLNKVDYWYKINSHYRT